MSSVIVRSAADQTGPASRSDLALVAAILRKPGKEVAMLSGRWRHCLLCAAWWLAGGAAASGQSQSVAPPAGGTVARTLMELRFLDDAGGPSRRESIAVRVLSDGTVCLPREVDGALLPVDRLSAERWQQLRQTSLHGALLQIDSGRLAESLHAACRQSGLSPQVEGAGETILRIETATGPHEVRCSALSVMAARFPQHPETQLLFAAQRQLQNVAAVAQAGGEQASAAWAALATPLFQQSCPGERPLLPHELTMYRQLSTGSRYVQFCRRPADGSPELVVSLFAAPGEQPRVSVSTLAAE